ncbi:MAG: L,D-transpeptidase/peptidoglycan binding protein [Thermoleophilaceae bacterium]|nr:L,D-transpeptidase/peptidoglycan binding protein [Thermoleophilaceae bacterium]
MGKAPFVFAAVLVVLLLAGAAGVYAYDSSREDMIADGVTVGGVDVGGMTADQAREELAAEIKRPLEETIEVKAGDERFELSAEDAKVDTDLRAMVRDALTESREGNILSRTLRDLTGGTENADLPSRVTYSRDAVQDLVASVEDEMNRSPQDAEVIPSGTGLETVAAEDGVEVKSKKLTRRVVAQLESPDRNVQVKASLDTVKPDVTEAELAEEFPYYMTVDRGSYELRFYENLKLQKTYSIAVGSVGFETPAGLYHIQNKAVDPAWSVPEWGGSLAVKFIPGGSANIPL